MPFPIVLGVPGDTPTSLLRKMRSDINTAVAEAMHISPDIVRTFILPDLAGDPDEGQDDTIYCRLDTGMFFGKPSTVELLAVRKNTTTKVASIIWDAFEGKYDVEVFPGDLNGEGRTLIRKKKQE